RRHAGHARARPRECADDAREGQAAQPAARQARRAALRPGGTAHPRRGPEHHAVVALLPGSRLGRGAHQRGPRGRLPADLAGRVQPVQDPDRSLPRVGRGARGFFPHRCNLQFRSPAGPRAARARGRIASRMNVNMENSPVAQDAPAAAGRSPEVDTASIRPIILVGLARSGTKWVSNIIASHEDVVAVQSPTAGGILETDMFEGLRDKFDLGFPTDYIGLTELWSRTEFFRLAGRDPEKFYRLDPRPRSPFAVFDLLMSDFARRHRCTHWLQKTSPLNALDVLDYFRSAKVVVVRRDLLDNARSALALRARHG